MVVSQVVRPECFHQPAGEQKRSLRRFPRGGGLNRLTRWRESPPVHRHALVGSDFLSPQYCHKEIPPCRVGIGIQSFYLVLIRESCTWFARYGWQIADK